MEELKLLDQVSTPSPVLVVQFDAARLGDYQRIARVLRAAGIGAEVYPETTKKIGKQFDYANDRGFRIVLIAGGDEFAKGEWKVKDMKGSRENPIELVVKEAELVKKIKKLLDENVH